MKLRWKATLSNDEVAIEGKKKFGFKKNKLSPWLSLQSYLKENNLSIVSLSLFYGNRVFSLPGIDDPNLSDFVGAKKPLYYSFGRMIAGSVGSGVDEHWCRIEAIYSYHRLQLWVNEYDPESCRVLVI